MKLPDLSQVNGFAYGENDLLLSPSSPMRSARKLLTDRYTIDASQLLYHHKGGFFVWTGTHYIEITDQYLTADIYHFLEYAKHKMKVKNPSGEEGFVIVPFHPNRSRVGEIHSALKAASHLSDMLTAPIWLDETPDLDPLEIIACDNGLLHLPTRSLLPHTPAFYTHNAISYAYEPAAPEPTKWLKFLADLWPDDPQAITTLQEIFGYCLVADTSQQKAFMLIGPKRSGKGTIARILEAVVGEHNVVAPTLTGLGTNFGRAPLIGKRLAIISDARISGKTDTSVVAECILSITGEDAITVDRKNRDAWTGKLKTKFLLISNELPRIGDASGALPSRFIVLILSESFFGREDHGLTKCLMSELPGILNWSIEGYDRLCERGYFQQPDSALDAIRDLEDLGSPIGAFVRDRCTVANNRSVLCSMLYSEWRNWCEEQGKGQPGTLQSFGRDLRAVVPALVAKQSREHDMKRVYFGIGLH